MKIFIFCYEGIRKTEKITIDRLLISNKLTDPFQGFYNMQIYFSLWMKYTNYFDENLS